MNDSFFQVQRMGTVGVNNVPTDSLLDIQTFLGTAVPTSVTLEDTASTNAVDVDTIVITREIVDVKINDSLLNLGNGIVYRVIKTFKYAADTRIWCSTQSS